MLNRGRTSAITISAIKNTGEANMSMDQARDQPSSPRFEKVSSINQSAPKRISKSAGIATIGGNGHERKCEAPIARFVSLAVGIPKLAKSSSTRGTAKARSKRKIPQV
jgi:hypothetical protein